MLVLCRQGGAARGLAGTFLGKRQARSCSRGVATPRPTYATARFRGAATGALPPGCTATGDRQGPLPPVPAPPPLRIGLCCRRSAPLDSFPSAPWAWRSRLRTGSWPGARRGSCCRLRGGGGGGNGGCGGGGASGRAWGGSRARPGSSGGESARSLGPPRWTPQSPGRLTSARVYGMEAGPSGAGKGPGRGTGRAAKTGGSRVKSVVPE